MGEIMKRINVSIETNNSGDKLCERLAQFQFEVILSRASRIADDSARRKFIAIAAIELERICGIDPDTADHEL